MVVTANHSPLLALLGYTIVSLAATVTAAYLIRRPSTVRAVLPGVDAIGFEVATLLLGVVTAGFVLRDPWLVPAVFVLVAVLHRSTLVKDLEVAAGNDTKTGLLTADAWHSLADQHLLRAERRGTPVAVLMIDLDHFKKVNDRFGHLAGDRTLKAVAVCVKEELRGYDAVGRFGGEEFIALLDGVATGNGSEHCGADHPGDPRAHPPHRRPRLRTANHRIHRGGQPPQRRHQHR